jgi:hypothetical protein
MVMFRRDKGTTIPMLRWAELGTKFVTGDFHSRRAFLGPHHSPKGNQSHMEISGQ